MMRDEFLIFAIPLALAIYSLIEDRRHKRAMEKLATRSWWARFRGKP